MRYWEWPVFAVLLAWACHANGLISEPIVRPVSELRVTAVGACDARLTWNAAQGSPTRYRIYWDSASVGTFQLLDSVAAPTTTYTQTGAEEQSRWYTESYYSSADSSVAGPDTVTQAPCRPGPGSIDATTSSSVDLSWSDSSDVNTGVLIEQCPGDLCSDFTQIDSIGDTTAYTVTGLEPDSVYRWRWRNTDGTLRSTYADAVQGTTQVAEAIALDDSVTVSDTTSADVLKWEHVVSTAPVDTPVYLLVKAHNESSVLRRKTVVATDLTGGADDTDQSSYTTASITPAANALIVACVTGESTDGSAATPTASGNGLTWVQDETVEWATNAQNQTCFHSMGSAPTTGGITFDFVEDQFFATWQVAQLDSVITTGANGADAVIQTAKDSATTIVTTLTVNLAAFGDAGNATFGSFFTDGAATAGTGFSLVGTDDTINAGWGVSTESRADNDQTVDMSWTTAVQSGGIAYEIAADTVTEPVLTFASATYGNQALSLIGGASDDVTDGSGFGNGLRFWRCDQDCLDAATDDTVRIDPSDADADIVGRSESYKRVARGGPEAAASDTAINLDNLRTPITTLSDSAWVVSALTASDSFTVTQTAGPERYEVRTFAAGGTRMVAHGSDFDVSPAGDTAVSRVIEEGAVARMVQGAVALTPAAAPVGGGDVTAGVLHVDGNWVNRMEKPGTDTIIRLAPDAYGFGAIATYGFDGQACDRNTVHVFKATEPDQNLGWQQDTLDNSFQAIMEDSISTRPDSELKIVLLWAPGTVQDAEVNASINPSEPCVIATGITAQGNLPLSNNFDGDATPIFSFEGQGRDFVLWGFTLTGGQNIAGQADCVPLGSMNRVYFRNLSIHYCSDGTLSPASAGDWVNPNTTYFSTHSILSAYGFKIHTEYESIGWSSLCRMVWLTTGIPTGSSGWRTPAPTDQGRGSEICQNVAYNSTVRWIRGFPEAEPAFPDIYDYYFKQGPQTQATGGRYIQSGNTGSTACATPDSLSIYIGRMVIDSIKSDSLTSFWGGGFAQCYNGTSWVAMDSADYHAGHATDPLRTEYTRYRDLFPDSIPFPWPDLTPQQVCDTLACAGGPQDVGDWYSLDESGQRVERRDSIAIQALDEFNSRTGSTRDSAGAYFAHGSGQAGEYAGYDTTLINSGTALLDTDDDALPDSFEVHRLIGYDAGVADAGQRLLDNGNAGPTDYECYLFEFQKFGHLLKWANDPDADSMVAQDSTRTGTWQREGKTTPPDTTLLANFGDPSAGATSYRVIYYGSNQDTTGVNTPGACMGRDTVGVAAP